MFTGKLTACKLALIAPAGCPQAVPPQAPQSPGHEPQLSPASQLALPQTGAAQAPQSPGQLEHVSPGSQPNLPQLV
ncbi:MAG: hypothetical protein IPG96_20325 [Proteobacteria bacterium]|nr:hypothetical protein [Pseudomonadota bacterium]